LTPLEAMATGVPVVAADVGAFSELVVDGGTGRIVPRDDLAAMTAAIEAYLVDEPARLSAAQAALLHARQNFPLEREVADLIAVYEDLWRRSALVAG
ncbi:MAG TPA: glycosyltransferase, partial [Rhizobiaceae bacterium]|nr:glycosyltransferase [Rhizobiaceae bacterium]